MKRISNVYSIRTKEMPTSPIQSPRLNPINRGLVIEPYSEE